MKCQHCGNNLNIEENFCPYCGQPNPFAVRHQEAMRRFEKDYESTKKGVLEQSSRFNRHTVRITILAVLLALIAATAILLIKANDIRWWRMEKRVEARADEHRAAIGELMDNRDYLGLYSYLTENDIRYTDSFREYDAVCDSSFQYMQIYENLMMLHVKKTDPEAFRYYGREELLQDVAYAISRINECLKPQSYNEAAYTAEKIAYMESLRGRVEVLLEGYLGLSREEAESTREMTMARINVLLEDSYGKEA